MGGNAGTSYAVNITDAGSGGSVIVGNYLQANTADIDDNGTSTTAASNG